jgi:hypothetical protein
VHDIQPLDVRRQYLRAAKDKENGRDWRRLQLVQFGATPKEVAVRDLEADPRCLTHKEKVAVYEQKGFGSPADYKRVLKRLRHSNRLIGKGVPPMPVKGKKPETPDEDRLREMTDEANMPPPNPLGTGTESGNGTVPQPEDVPAGTQARETFEQGQPEQQPQRRRPPERRPNFDDTVGFEKDTRSDAGHECPECGLISNRNPCPDCGHRHEEEDS